MILTKDNRQLTEKQFNVLHENGFIISDIKNFTYQECSDKIKEFLNNYYKNSISTKDGKKITEKQLNILYQYGYKDEKIKNMTYEECSKEIGLILSEIGAERDEAYHDTYYYESDWWIR